MSHELKNEASNLAIKLRKHQTPDEEHEPVAIIKGDFFIIAQGDQVIMLTKKQMFKMQMVETAKMFIKRMEESV